MNSNNVAIIHCNNGRSRTGILIACLLKLIGAFEHSAQAFDFFCSARSQTEVKPTLAPSYRILFENIDQAINLGAYANRKPMHLKCVAIAGLPLDEIPCIEVWDTVNGLIYSSHSGTKVSHRCTWSADYGDGFFTVAQDIIGDFSILCRFGGNNALTKDKTTLIFKYQNHTGFLPCEVIELRQQNIDVNPDYAENIDQDLFSVHLMLETSMNKDYSKYLPDLNFSTNKSFTLGLEEVSPLLFS
jgi:hypothetical protein